ncbi:MAG TPA: RecQ family ATP-dependent DNA helicase [Actinomycetota bacterium]|nr:RecQ family ATP-dependent DNA helicase [Actinomycetota bacterium]
MSRAANRRGRREPLEARARSLLRRLVGPGASFRDGQLEAIRAIVSDRGRVLVVQRTGWGKSAVYLIGTRLLRDEGAGPTMLVSPLLALMRNQIDMAARIGVRAETINSANTEEWARIEEAVRLDAVDLLLIAPERFNNDRFRTEVLPHIAHRTGLLVVDEAHCISDWGHDFRPDYRRLVRVLDLLPRGIPILCTTATANERVIADIDEQLGPDLVVQRGPLDRESLVLSVLDIPSQADRLAWLATAIPELPGSGIVYVLTVADTERVASWLRSRGIAAQAYSGESEAEARLRIEEDLLENRLKVVVATSALGMGYDKPDIGFVIHYQAPGSPIAYYQQVGRAGRAVERAPAVLLRGREDEEIQDYFIRTAFPPRHQAEEVVRLLEERAEPVSINGIMAAVNVRKSRLEAMLKILEVEGAVERVEGKWRRTLRPWAYPEERVARVTAARRAEQAAMRAYGQEGCLMEFLRRALDDPAAEPCGRCMNCTGEAPAFRPPARLADAARRHLRSVDLVIEPRRRWPSSLEFEPGGPPELPCLEQGRALSVYDDGGWGGDVRRGKYELGRYPQELVEASVRLIRRRWKPRPPPRWVTCVPSLTHPEPVPRFAEELARALGLPFLPVVEKVRPTRPQKEMENSQQQAKNVLGAFRVNGEVPKEPVLLVDDIVDSRWTLTVVGAALRDAGSGPVFPFVLAQAVGA